MKIYFAFETFNFQQTHRWSIITKKNKWNNVSRNILKTNDFVNWSICNFQVTMPVTRILYENYGREWRNGHNSILWGYIVGQNLVIFWGEFSQIFLIIGRKIDISMIKKIPIYGKLRECEWWKPRNVNPFNQKVNLSRATPINLFLSPPK